jgi:hypothetical protein
VWPIQQLVEVYKSAENPNAQFKFGELNQGVLVTTFSLF